MRNSWILVIVFICCGSIVGQNDNEEDIVGIFQGELYSNHVLGFSFKVPSKWYVPTKDQIKKYEEIVKNELQTGNPKFDKKGGRYDKIEFAISKKKIDEPENSVLGYAVTKQPSSSITAKMVAEATKDHFLKISDFKLIKDISTERHGNRDFTTFEMGLHSFPKQRVRTYMMMQDVYLITFILTYCDEDSLKVMMDSLNTIKFQ